MVENLGLTLTPDSMVTFRDATWPMLIMSFLAFAGNTFYPCFLRLLIWSIYKIAPITSSLKESLRFLLDHPRRCYTLLLPGAATWILAAILVVLDLDNPEVNVLPVGPRIAAAIVQAASARHTGTASFNLANVNPAVQFSLLVMMYISIYPIAISIRMSSDYEEQSIGLYGVEERLDEQRGGKAYLINYMWSQLSFDLWYIFLGLFCICCSESNRIVSRDDYMSSQYCFGFSMIVLLTVLRPFLYSQFSLRSSRHGNVGLSLGHPSNSSSLSGHFNAFSKLVVCAMMLRGRHRGLPCALDRAVTLPSDKSDMTMQESQTVEHGKQNATSGQSSSRRGRELKGREMLKSYTQ
jgi:potassium uptake Trk family protein